METGEGMSERNLAAECAARAMTLASERMDEGWSKMEREVIRLAYPPHPAPLVTLRFRGLCIRFRESGPGDLQSGLVGGYGAPILESEFRCCQRIAQEMINYDEAFARLVEAQKGGA
jgi:hypothetical protein